MQRPVAGAASGPADDMSFTLAAPEQQDSFDSDTNLSASNFQPTSVMAPTVDPMAPVPDPTGNWDGFDLSTLNENGALEGAVATVAQSANLTSAPVGSPEMGISEKTFYSQSYRAKSKVGLMVGGTLLAMLIVGGISYAVIFGFQKGSSDEVADAGDGDKEKKEGDGDKDSGDDAKSTTSDGSKTGDNRQAEPDPEQGGDAKGSGDEDTKSMKKNPTDGEPDGDPGPGTGTPEPEKKGDPPKKKDDEPAEEMKKEAPKDLPPPKNSEIAELARLLGDARQKLVERNMVETTRLLDKAGNMPILPDHKLKLDRLKEVAELYGKFWNKVVEGCGKLKGLDEIKFSDTNVVGVVESSEEKIVYKALGKRFEKAPRELQIGLAMKIAEKEMNVEDVEFRMVKGAVFAIDAINNPDRAEQAKILWEEAKLLGGETDELILFLDDTYDLLAGVIKKEKIPEGDAATAAQEKFKTTYEAQLKTASRNQKAASELASQLLADVPTMDQPADRHANFVAAIFYASKFGDVELTMKAISDMNKWFSIDMEKETLDALTKMNRNRLKPDQKREITRTAFEFMDRAKADSNKELELKFAELALLSARGTRDPKLIQTAENEVRRVKAAASMPDSNQ
ncbi:MAG: hypothetical protein VX768_08250 [Planctomycetota bacterium]|nr:hypothetical protein [Planctomycetota bacterium]